MNPSSARTISKNCLSSNWGLQPSLKAAYLQRIHELITHLNTYWILPVIYRDQSMHDGENDGRVLARHPQLTQVTFPDLTSVQLSRISSCLSRDLTKGDTSGWFTCQHFMIYGKPKHTYPLQASVPSWTWPPCSKNYSQSILHYYPPQWISAENPLVLKYIITPIQHDKTAIGTWCLALSEQWTLYWVIYVPSLIHIKYKAPTAQIYNVMDI